MRISALEFIRTIRSFAATNAKIMYTTETYEQVGEVAKKLLQYAYDPYKVYNVKKVEVDLYADKALTWKGLEQFFLLLNALESKKYTGNRAKKLLRDFILPYTLESQEILLGILDKDLRINLGVKSINKAIPGAIREFNVMLANDCDAVHHANGKVEIITKLQNAEYLLDLKYDGLRGVAIKLDGNVSLFSRNGRKLVFPYLEQKLNIIMDDGMVFEGEIYTGDGFRSLMQQAHRLYGRNLAGICYIAFDMLPYADFINGRCDIPLRIRRKELKKRIADDKSGVIFISKAKKGTLDNILPFYYKATSLGFEGEMIKLLDAPYEAKRSNYWLKLKPERTIDGKILGFEEGKGKWAGMAGKVLVDTGLLPTEKKVGLLLSDKGTVITKASCGSLPDSIKKWAWVNRKKLLGHMIEVIYQEQTHANNLRNPRIHLETVMKRFRPDKDEVVL